MEVFFKRNPTSMKPCKLHLVSTMTTELANFSLVYMTALNISVTGYSLPMDSGPVDQFMSNWQRLQFSKPPLRLVSKMLVVAHKT